MTHRPNRYTPDQLPPVDLATRDWLLREFGKIADLLDNPFIPELHVAPSKPREGTIVEADGSNWDPGLGEGLYYFDGTWRKLAYLPIARGDLDTGLLNFLRPGHRLSLGATGVAIPTSDVVAGTTLRWTPFEHKQTPIFNGTLWLNQAIGELTYSLHATSDAAATNYNIWLDWNAGTSRLVRGPAWSSDTAPTANDEPIGDATYGYLVNTGTITVQLSANGGTASKAAGLLLYLGTIRTVAAGQVDDSLAKRFVWNFWNRVPRPMRVFDPTNTWNYDGVYRQARATATNELAFVRGFDQDAVRAVVKARFTHSSGNVALVSIGLDSTTAKAADATASFVTAAASGAAAVDSLYEGLPGRGYHRLVWLEGANAATTTWIGDAGGTNEQSGILGHVMA